MRGAAFEMAGMVDSALVVYKKTLALGGGSDVTLSLLVAKTIVDHAVYDTAEARRRTVAKDSLGLRAMQQTFAEKVDSARPYLHPGLSSSDSAQRLTAAVIMLTGGSKIAQAAAYDKSYIWLDTLLQVVAPRSPADTVGPRHQIRLNASFWFGLSSVLTLSKPYQDMVKSKKCDPAKAIHDRLVRTRAALLYGERVHPATVRQMTGFLTQYEQQMPRVKQAFKCRNF
jgi:hypothetical protein